MFLCVWLHFKKFSGKNFLVFGKEEGKHKSRKTQATTQIQSDDKSNPTARSRSRLLREIAIDGAISRRRDRDLPLSPLIFLSRHRRDPPLSPTYAISRSTLRENTPSITISIRCDLAKARSRSTVTGMFAGEIAIVGLCRLSRARTLSLSL